MHISYTGFASNSGSMAALSQHTKPVHAVPPVTMSSSSNAVVPGRMMSETSAVGVR